LPGPHAVRLAVIASIRQDIGYEDLLMSGVPRDEARELVGTNIDRMLDFWLAGG
jgi:hypothetical protein